jgi:hypothetical protein
MGHDLQNDCQERSILAVLPEVSPLLNLQEGSLFEQNFGIHEADSEMFHSRFVNCDKNTERNCYIKKYRRLWKHCDSQTKKNLLLGTRTTKTKKFTVSHDVKTSQTENKKGR